MITDDQNKRYHDLLKEQKKINRKARKRVKKHLRIQMLSGGFIGLSIVFIALVMVLSTSQDKEVFTNMVYLGMTCFLIGSVLHIFIHEAGHLIFGLLTDYEFLSYRVFSILLYKKNGALHLGKYSVKGTGGQCLMYPPKKDRYGRFPYVLYNLGGSICNFFFSIPCLLVFLVTENPMVRISSYAFLVAGVLAGLINLVPMNAVIQNDGMNVKSMKQDPDLEEAFYLQLKINAEMSNGKRITEYDKKEIVLPGYEDNTNLLATTMRLCAYNRELTLQNYEEAEHMLTEMEKHLEEYSLPVIHSLQLERLFFSVLNHCPIEEIAALFKSSALLFQKQKSNFTVMRVLYCMEAALSEEEKKNLLMLILPNVNKKRRRNKKAVSLDSMYNHFLKIAETYPNEGEASMHVSIMEHLRSQLQTPENLLQ